MKPVMIPTTDVNSETAIVTDWRVPDRSPVQAGALVAEVETSKAVLDVLAPDSGYLLRGADVGKEVSLAEPLAYLFPTPDALEAHTARLAKAAVEVAATTSEDMRATVPATRRAAELGVDLASVATGELVTVKMVEAAAGSEAATPPPELLSPLDAPTGVERVAIIGAGFGANQVIDIFATDPTGLTPRRRRQHAVAVIDDDQSRWEGRLAGVPIVGGAPQLEDLFASGHLDSGVIAIGTSIPARTRYRELCGALGIPLTNAIDPTARICTDVELGTGNIICAHCHFGVGTRVGDNNMLSAHNSFDHHNVLGTDITTGPGCTTSGLVHIGDRVRMGMGICIEPHVEIGSGAQVASGAVIVKSVPPGHAVKRHVATTTTVPIRLPGERRNGSG